MSESLVAAAASLLGVVLGAVFTYMFTRRNQASKALHESRIAAYSRFGAAVMEYRRALMERWYVAERKEDPSGAAAAVYSARSVAWGTLFEVQLLAQADRVSETARSAVDATSAIKDADDRASLVAAAENSRRGVELFVAAARSDVAASFDVL